MTARVSVLIPTYNEEEHLERCLASIEEQTSAVDEVFVVDGGSVDRTREIARQHARVIVLDNPRRMQAAALNIGLAAATGEVIVRVDGHCVLERDYVERAVEALRSSGAAVVGGAMQPVGRTRIERAIAAAMTSPFGAGPARFHVGGSPGWVDTVYLGAFRSEVLRDAGGWAEDVGVNEDAELAHRLRDRGGVWFDPALRSQYMPRSSLRSLCRQFFRYGRSRAATVRRHPSSLAVRQLAAPALVVGLMSPRRRAVAMVYGGIVAVACTRACRREVDVAVPFAVALPLMHVSWGTGFLLGAITGPPRPRTSS
jgi:glycosyltransferase involved in cell wall biosynthesis